MSACHSIKTKPLFSLRKILTTTACSLAAWACSGCLHSQAVATIKPDATYPQRVQAAELHLQQLQEALPCATAAVGTVKILSAAGVKEKHFNLSRQELATLKDCLSRAKTKPMKHAVAVHPTPPRYWVFITLSDSAGKELIRFEPLSCENNLGFVRESFCPPPEFQDSFVRPHLSLPDADIVTMRNLPTVNKMRAVVMGH